jgi:hypothetical protein
MKNPILRAETTTTINLLISTADIINNNTMGNELYATGAGTTSSTLETRDNVIKATNTTTTSRNNVHENDNQSETEQCKPVAAIKVVCWLAYIPFQHYKSTRR